jgi:hypothetical protein
MSKVRVIGDETGNVINQSATNPDYGYVRLEQVKTTIDDNGFLRRRSISTLVQGLVSDLKAENYFSGQELSGKIVVLEAITPFNKKNPERDIKQAGDTGIVCSIEGLPIYRKTLYSLSSNTEDVFIKHDNVEQIRNAFNGVKTSAVNAEASDEFNF